MVTSTVPLTRRVSLIPGTIKEQADVRVGGDIHNGVSPLVTGAVGNDQRHVVDHCSNKARLVSSRRGISPAFAVGGGNHQKRRKLDKRFTMRIQAIELFSLGHVARLHTIVRSNCDRIF